MVKLQLCPLDANEKKLINRVFCTEKAALEAVRVIEPPSMKYTVNGQPTVEIVQINLEGNELEGGGVFFEEQE